MDMSKKVYATGDKVFTHVSKGCWEASLYGEPVTLERVHHDHWQCIGKAGKVLGEGTTRNNAMREAFYNMALEEGYDAKEADRLDWILVPQKYRSYGGHKARKKTVNIENVKGYDNVKKIVRKDDTEHPDDPLQHLRDELAHYKTSYNKVLGGWHYYKRDDEGKIVDGIKGPFLSEKEMLMDMIKNEL